MSMVISAFVFPDADNLSYNNKSVIFQHQRVIYFTDFNVRVKY